MTLPETLLLLGVWIFAAVCVEIGILVLMALYAFATDIGPSEKIPAQPSKLLDLLTDVFALVIDKYMNNVIFDEMWTARKTCCNFLSSLLPLSSSFCPVGE
jgi:hypothetical protein